MMHAVIETHGRQHLVRMGDVLQLEGKRITVGDEVVFDRVLLLDDQIGTPLIQGAKVVGKIVGTRKGTKLYITKYRRRKDSRRRIGFRASLYRVEITQIAGTQIAGGA